MTFLTVKQMSAYCLAIALHSLSASEKALEVFSGGINFSCGSYRNIVPHLMPKHGNWKLCFPYQTWLSAGKLARNLGPISVVIGNGDERTKEHFEFCSAKLVKWSVTLLLSQHSELRRKTFKSVTEKN